MDETNEGSLMALLAPTTPAPNKEISESTPTTEGQDSYLFKQVTLYEASAGGDIANISPVVAEDLLNEYQDDAQNISPEESNFLQNLTDNADIAMPVTSNTDTFQTFRDTPLTARKIRNNRIVRGSSSDIYNYLRLVLLMAVDTAVLASETCRKRIEDSDRVIVVIPASN